MKSDIHYLIDLDCFIHKSTHDCPARTIDEAELQRVVVAAVNEVFEQKDGYINHLKKNIENVLGDHTESDNEYYGAMDDSQYLEKEDRLIYEHSVDEIRSLPELEAKIAELQGEVLQKTKAGENTDDLKAEIDRPAPGKEICSPNGGRQERGN